MRFKLAPKNAPKPPVHDLKYRYQFRNSKGHLTTWCPWFREYLEEKVVERKLANFIDLEKTRAKAGHGHQDGDLKGDKLIDVHVIHGYADANTEQKLWEELKAVNVAKEVMSVQQPTKMIRSATFTEEDLPNVRLPHCDALVVTVRIG
ncbi:hypothetical protein Vadar_003920 [Vaccinium darrowii]|uniref:Uncharacterized protein n=1 Tax=Vaccinium darrowii TaxID=229202 RepID=A0ACB7ZGZ3_9ERIC|nr:hypothetical protein Vadar_003920 [Vaccinium darrowii]